MQAQAVTPFVQQSQAASEVVLGSIAVYRGVKKVLSIFAFYLLVIISIPIIPLVLICFWVVLLNVRVRLKKALRTEVEITTSNYASLRKEYDFLQTIQQKVVSSGLPENISLDNTFMGIFHIRAIVRIFNTRKHALESAFNSLNPKTTSFDDILVPLKEDELWRNRTKAYDYLM
jgi:amino acid transporter